MYIICIKDLISNKWRQVIIPLFESSIIMNPNNMYMICIKDLILNKWRQVIIPLSQKFYVQLLLLNKTQVIICIKDLIWINSAKFHPIISTVKFHAFWRENFIFYNKNFCVKKLGAVRSWNKNEKFWFK